jgi:hypothetical protein
MKKLLLISCMTLLLVSCAQVQPNVVNCLQGHVYGFWGGLLHGIIAPFAFIGSLFSDSISVWAVNNNGGWYTFGFLIGIGGFSITSCKAKR